MQRLIILNSRINLHANKIITITKNKVVSLTLDLLVKINGRNILTGCVIIYILIILSKLSILKILLFICIAKILMGIIEVCRLDMKLKIANLEQVNTSLREFLKKSLRVIITQKIALRTRLRIKINILTCKLNRLKRQQL